MVERKKSHIRVFTRKSKSKTRKPRISPKRSKFSGQSPSFSPTFSPTFRKSQAMFKFPAVTPGARGPAPKKPQYVSKKPTPPPVIKQQDIPFNMKKIQQNIKQGWTVVTLKNSENRKEIKKLLNEKVGAYNLIHGNPAHKRSNYPVIFFNGKLVGRYKELKEYFRQLEEFELLTPDINPSTKFGYVPYGIYSDALLKYINSKFKNACVLVSSFKSYDIDTSRGSDYNYLFANRDKLDHFSIIVAANIDTKNVTIFADPTDIRKKFQECLQRTNKPDFIIINLSISYLGGTSREGHANMLIYNVKTREIERFDPQTATTEMRDLDEKLKEWLFEALPNDILYYRKPSEYCPDPNLFQAYQNKQYYDRLLDEPAGKYSTDDPTGFCNTWSLWYIMQKLSYPLLTSRQVIELSMNKIKNLDDVTAFIDNWAKFLGNYLDEYYGMNTIRKQDSVSVIADQNVDVSHILNILDRSNIDYFFNKFDFNDELLLNKLKQTGVLGKMNELESYDYESILRKCGGAIISYKDLFYCKTEFDKFYLPKFSTGTWFLYRLPFDNKSGVVPEALSELIARQIENNINVESLLITRGIEYTIVDIPVKELVFSRDGKDISKFDLFSEIILSYAKTNLAPQGTFRRFEDLYWPKVFDDTGKYIGSKTFDIEDYLDKIKGRALREKIYFH